MPNRSYLYVPGDRVDRFDSALRRGADAVVIDLEDSVPLAAKSTARTDITTWLTTLTGPYPELWVRVNAGGERGADLTAIATCDALTGLILAKTETVDEVAEVDQYLTQVGAELVVAPLLESAAAIENMAAIARGPRVRLLHLGEVDLAADLDMTVSGDGRELLSVRSSLVIASRSARVLPPVAPVGLETRDMHAFEKETRALRAMGFFGRACIHPKQVQIANDVHRPTEQEVAWAESVMSGAANSASGAFLDERGAMVDEAVLRRARRIVGLAGSSGSDLD